MLKIRSYISSDLGAMVDIFRACFADSIRHYFGDRLPRPDVYHDLFAFLAEAEAGSIWIAELDNVVVGYIVTPSSITRLYRAALTSRLSSRIVWRTVSGTYGLPFSGLALLIVDKLRMGLSPVIRDFRGGQVLSLGVLPAARGNGAATRLVEAGLAYLADESTEQVKLEVREENKAAHHLYAKLGFRPVGVVADSQGKWIVMTRALNQPKATGGKEHDH